jgi:L-asparaginase/beta-aspartyl-peptidase (threonine type)
VYVGPAGAVVASGDDPAIIKSLLARRVHELLEEGLPAKNAAHTAIAELPEGAQAGVVAIDKIGWGAAANAEFGFAVAFASGDEAEAPR